MLLNVKLFVFGYLVLNVYDFDNGYGEEVLDFELWMVWWGLVNWIVWVGLYLEVGFVCDDLIFVEEVIVFVVDVIVFFELIDMICVGFELNFV